MKFRATVQVMPRKWILDPQGKVMFGLKNLGFDHFASVRMDKRIELKIEVDISM